MLSGSMEPAFYRGDILFLYKGAQPIRAGEVVVFDINGRDIPIVHRVIKVHEENEGGPIQASSSRLPSLPLAGCMCTASSQAARLSGGSIASSIVNVIYGRSRQVPNAWLAVIVTSDCERHSVVLSALQILTKGDNNFADDYAGNLYSEGQRWLANKHIMGRVVG